MQANEFADDFEKHYGHSATPADLWHVGYQHGEIDTFYLIIRSFEWENAEPLPGWFKEWIIHLKKNREEFLTKFDKED